MKNLLLILLAGTLIAISCKPVTQNGEEEKDGKCAVKTNNQVPEYTGESLKTIRFPLGGIATGNFMLGGRGNLANIEIMNRPNKGNDNRTVPGCLFTIYAKPEGGEVFAKALERQLLPPYDATHGIMRNQLAGVARFDEVVFRGQYPFANLEYIDDKSPVEVNLEAYNPFIPLDADNSSIPIAVFNWKVKNTSSKKMDVSIAFCMENPLYYYKDGKAQFKNVNEYVDKEGLKGVVMKSSDEWEEDKALNQGEIAVLTSLPTAEVQLQWYHGGWWDQDHIYWDDFSGDGHLEENKEPGKGGDVMSVNIPVVLEPGEEKVIPIYISWSFPNNYGNQGTPFKNYYATLFEDAFAAAKYYFDHEEKLYSETKLFHDIVFSSTYPAIVTDAITANMAYLKTNLLQRDSEGNVHGWEGLSPKAGCCMGTCTHVWNYENTLAYLFPELERSMREIAFFYETYDNGYQIFRSIFPPTPEMVKYNTAADGQMGNVVRVYREWKLSGDTEWLKKMWPRTQAALEFAWKGVSKDDKDYQEHMGRYMPVPWDADKDGVMEGMQHNTYDIEFFGPNTMMGSLYMAALKAGAEMAKAMGEPEKAKEYMEIYEKGSERYDELLWKDDYYIQIVKVEEGITVRDALVSPESCDTTGCGGKDPVKCCPGKESPGGKKPALKPGEIIPKYQYGEGCLSDQLLGQYLAFVNGLGYVFDEENVKQALKSIYTYNFLEDMTDYSNVQRVYALGDDAGLLLCSWPKGKRPVLPFVYSDEVWSGIEYQVAASLIYAGHIDEGLDIVRAVRERHRGWNRNPWDEFECGSHYARALASWAVMLGLSDYQYDGVENAISFGPRINQKDFYSFFSNANAWGSVEIKASTVKLKVAKGSMDLDKFCLTGGYSFSSVSSAEAAGQKVDAQLEEKDGKLAVILASTVRLNEGDELVIKF